MKYSVHYLFLLGSLSYSASNAQLPSNRIRPATMYYAGDTVRSPRLGLQTRVPDGWEGVLPRDAEVFLLMAVNNINGQIYVAANEHIDMTGQVERWKKGLEIADGLHLKPDGEMTTRGDVVCSFGKVTGYQANNDYKIYLEAKCSPYGFCLSYMLIADPGSFEAVKKALQAFVDNTQFTEPSTASPYLNFDWKRFLSGKVLLMSGYEGSGQNKKENQVDFCSDGTFTSRIVRKGLLKTELKGYQGNKKGLWEVKSNGSQATIALSIPKLPPAEVTVEIRDEEIYVNGIRYFVGNSEKCR